ncbi:hypothetical protein [Okeania sp.]|uniref:hypothetical protein n=1 Tax=Okeania sp. TaxID=3100323 RepID=UPI002B4B8B46|nr:hypothetical protein [Okeania sp.]MEB3339562.1 hypothetical protein [Okeania sp.]
MKSNSKNNEPDGNEQVPQKSPHPFLLSLILTGILAAEAYPNLTETAIASVKVLQSSQVEITSQITTKTDRFVNIEQTSVNGSFDNVKKLSKPIFNLAEKLTNQVKKIPHGIIEAVYQDLENRIGIVPETIKVNAVSQETWPNTCLGLAKNDELCGQRLVEGWRLILSNGKDQWIYRTDNRGKLMRLEI